MSREKEKASSLRLLCRRTAVVEAEGGGRGGFDSTVSNGRSAAELRMCVGPGLWQFSAAGGGAQARLVGQVEFISRQDVVYRDWTMALRASAAATVRSLPVLAQVVW